MLTQLQRNLLAALSGPDPAQRGAVEMVLCSQALAAGSGDESLVPGLLLILAAALDQGAPLAEPLRRMAAISLRAAASSPETVRVIAGTSGKRGRRPSRSRDGAVWWRYLELRATGETTENAEATVATEFHLSPEAVNSVVDKLREQHRRSEEVIKRADDLLRNEAAKK